MRCDANISVAGGKRVEVKNISSFKDVARALKFEITRQRNLLARGVEDSASDAGYTVIFCNTDESSE